MRNCTGYCLRSDIKGIKKRMKGIERETYLCHTTRTFKSSVQVLKWELNRNIPSLKRYLILKLYSLPCLF